MRTLQLNPYTWDLTLDKHGNLAVADRPYAIAQDVASACRLFLGELWYDTTQGLPYFQQILGYAPSTGFIIAQLTKAALSVPNVVSVNIVLNPLKIDRRLSGTITIIDDRGQTTTQNITSAELPWYVNAVTGAQASPDVPFPNYLLDDFGNIVLDDNGNPILL